MAQPSAIPFCQELHRGNAGASNFVPISDLPFLCFSVDSNFGDLYSNV
uniref:Uncharacterized protein n=1 Tax=Rhizophora mucronata TaxID=61149 RepID=A0A2P2Q8E7_RHIMU